jgi:hypothetical protein
VPSVGTTTGVHAQMSPPHARVAQRHACARQARAEVESRHRGDDAWLRAMVSAQAARSAIQRERKASRIDVAH